MVTYYHYYHHYQWYLVDHSLDQLLERRFSLKRQIIRLGASLLLMYDSNSYKNYQRVDQAAFLEEARCLIEHLVEAPSWSCLRKRDELS